MTYPAHILDGAEEFCVECDDEWNGHCCDEDHPRLIDPDADFHWVICDRCNGDGMLRGYPGAYTQDEFYEAFADPDEYLDFRRDCEDCRGTGKVRVLRDEAATRPAVAAWIRDYYDSRTIERQERMMGA